MKWCSQIQQKTQDPNFHYLRGGFFGEIARIYLLCSHKIYLLALRSENDREKGTNWCASTKRTIQTYRSNVQKEAFSAGCMYIYLEIRILFYYHVVSTWFPMKTEFLSLLFQRKNQYMLPVGIEFGTRIVPLSSDIAHAPITHVNCEYGKPQSCVWRKASVL